MMFTALPACLSCGHPVESVSWERPEARLVEGWHGASLLVVDPGVLYTVRCHGRSWTFADGLPAEVGGKDQPGVASDGRFTSAGQRR